MVKKENFVDKTIDMFFSKDKTKLYIFLLFVIAFILRLIAANNLEMYADDANHAVRPVGIIGSGKLDIWDQSSALWYYAEDVFYKIIGDSQMGSRFATALFGALFVVLIFLFVNQIFKSKKAALISSVFATFSPFLIKMNLPEMDIAVMFFVMFSALFIFKYTESGKNKDLLLTSVLIGIAILIKVYALFFAFSFLLFLIYNSIRSKKKLGKTLIIFCAVVFIFCIPTIVNNYLLYKDKGFMDLMFTNFFKKGIDKAQPLYGWGAGWMPYTDFKGFFLGNQKNFQGETGALYKLPGFIVVLSFVLVEDPLIFIFGLIGVLLLLFKKDKKYLVFFILCLIPAFVYMGSNIPMAKHFVFIPCLLLPIVGITIDKLDESIKRKFPKFKLRYLIIGIIIFNLLWLGKGSSSLHSHFYDTDASSQLIKLKNDNIPQTSLVIVDARIYRGFTSWMFNDRFYIESTIFSQAYQESAKYGEPEILEVYFVECVKDDCGWGTIANQPDFNKSSEEIVGWFANNSIKLAELKNVDKKDYYFPVISKKDEVPVYRVYKTSLMINPSILELARSTHVWYMYPIGYDETITPIFDNYTTHNSMDKLLDWFAHFIFYLSLIMIFLFIIVLFYLLVKEE